MERATLGIIGCGAVSNVYFEAGDRFDVLDIAACADPDADHAEVKADEYGVPRVLVTEDLLAGPVIDVAVVLTPAGTHGDLVSVAPQAGKYAYTEESLAATKTEGEAILETADERGLTVGIAPDTVFGTGTQTCHDLIDGGRIGDPVGATTFWSNYGHEHRHPDPDGFYTEGDGLLFDMGPYYLTSLVTFLGPIRSIVGTADTPFTEREMTSEPRRSGRIPVSMLIHETAVVIFESGMTGMLLASFDVWGSGLPGFKIYGTEGMLSVTDLNRFDETPRVHFSDDGGEWREISIERDYPGQQHSLGPVDPVYSLDSDWDHRTSGDLRSHAPEAMDGTHESAERGMYVELSAQCERPPSVPNGFPTDLDPADDAK